jgi:hypothetical protein
MKHDLLLLVALVPIFGQDPTPPDGAGEPPLRVRVTLGTETHLVTVGRPYRSRLGGELIQVDLMPTRELRVEGAFAFEYPREMRFGGSMATGDTDAWCTLTSSSTSIFLRRHGGDPAAIAEEYVRNSVAGGATAVAEVTLALDGRALHGKAASMHIGGFHGWETDAVQEIYGFEQGGVAWLLVLQKNLTELPEQILGLTLDAESGLVLLHSRETDETARVVELLRTSFRFLGG